MFICLIVRFEIVEEGDEEVKGDSIEKNRR